MRTLICLALFCFSAQSLATTTTPSCRTVYKNALAAYKAEITQARATIDVAYKMAQTTLTADQNAAAEEFKACHAQARQNYDQNIRTAKNNQDVLAVIAQHEKESKQCGTDYSENIADTYTVFAEHIAQAQAAYNAQVAQARTNYDIAVLRCQ